MLEAIPLVVPGSIRPLVSFSERAGLKLPRRATKANGAGPLPLVAAGGLFADLAEEFNTEAIGLRVGSATRFEDTPLGHSVSRSPTVAAALFGAIAASGRYCGGQQVWMAQEDGCVSLHRRHSRELQRGRRQANDFALHMLIDMLRRAAGAKWRPLELHLEGRPTAPAHAEELASLSTRSTRFDASEDCLVFSASTLALSLPPVRTKPEDVSVADVGFERSLRVSIEYLMEIGALSLPHLAELAGTSTRSLQRRLSESGISFVRLASEVRFEVAARLLRDPAARIIDVSNQLDYTDAANFARAFRRWAGVSPQAFQRAHLPDSVVMSARRDRSDAAAPRSH